MRRKISLYIADQLVDLDDQSFILFNYTMEDLSNPTIVRNSFSQSITLKGTPNNNKVFGGIWRFDRVTQYSSAYDGVYFDAARKTPFTIYNELNEKVESGYLKLDEVVRSSGMVEYKVTLYGGLGSFFYGLSFKDDGSPMTLADLSYKSLTGEYSNDVGLFPAVGAGLDCVKDAWSYLADPDNYQDSQWSWSNVINFAPCYNGIPEGFDCQKGLFADSSGVKWSNVYQSKIIDGVEYTKHPDASSVLLSFSNPHTEWEMRDLRWYMQRPVINIPALIDAICNPANNGGYVVELDERFFRQSLGHEYLDMWMTLQMIPVDKRNEADVIHQVLAASKTPADYLISFAKIFGLVFLCDPASKKITLMLRTTFYNAAMDTSLIDLTKRIDDNSISMKHLLADTKFYQFGGEAVGAWAKDYRKQYGRDYAAQRVNTGYDFNSDIKEVTADIIYKNGVDVQERSLLFTSDAYQSIGDDRVYHGLMTLPTYEVVKSQLWNSGESVEVDAYMPPESYIDYIFPINSEYPLSDLFPKVQLHEEENKSVDGADMLFFFTGFVELPSTLSLVQTEQYYYLTDDHPDTELLNDGTPCFNFTDVNSIPYRSIPCFRRNRVYRGVRDVTMDYGQPYAFGFHVGNDDYDTPALYERYWGDYLSDRYDDDTFRMTCKVDLRGMQVGQSLMRRFFYYNGAVFVLNKITNHSLTTWDDTECEFVKVQDINNYIV